MCVVWCFHYYIKLSTLFFPLVSFFYVTLEHDEAESA